MKVINLLNATYELKEELLSSSEYKEVINAQEEMLKDSYVDLLMQYYQTAQGIYNDALKYNMDSKDELQLKLAKSKDILYRHPLVATYLEKLKVFNALLGEVQDEIFEEFASSKSMQAFYYKKEEK